MGYNAVALRMANLHSGLAILSEIGLNIFMTLAKSKIIYRTSYTYFIVYAGFMFKDIIVIYRKNETFFFILTKEAL